MNNPIFRRHAVLVILQNAYNKGTLSSGSRYSFRHWFREFEQSRSGVRLAEMFGRETLRRLHYTNTTSIIGVGPDSQLKVDIAHLRRSLLRVQPRLVVACGKQAEQACLNLAVQDLFCIPHPAHRLLTNKLLEEAGNAVKWRLIFLETPTITGLPSLDWLREPCVRVAFRQRRNKIVNEKI